MNRSFRGGFFVPARPVFQGLLDKSPEKSPFEAPQPRVSFRRPLHEQQPRIKERLNIQSAAVYDHRDFDRRVAVRRAVPING